MERVDPYSLLAAGYEAVMAHVDYDAWAWHVRRLLARHHPGARDVLELGCGTGALARTLQPLGPPPDGFRYRATDRSDEMLAVARREAAAEGVPVTFERADFRAVPAAPAADAVLLLYDGLNYLLEPPEVAALLAGAFAALRPGGVFVVDQSTPANSENIADGFDDAGETEAFSYLRTSRYDRAARLHTTTFHLRLPDGREAGETHVQRAYALEEVGALVAASPFARVAAYDGLTLQPATAASERVHWVLRRPG
jgi:SAM-dependent methyltransferase